MARRGFNRNQKRDRRGRFAKGGGGSSSFKSKNTPYERKRLATGIAAGAAIGFYGTLGNPLAAIAGAAIGGGLISRSNRNQRKG